MMVHNHNHNHNHSHNNNNGNSNSNSNIAASIKNGQRQQQQRRRSSRNNLVSQNTIKSIISHSLVGIFCLYIGILIGMSNQIRIGVGQVGGAVKDGVVPSSPAVVVPLPISMTGQPNQNQHRLVAAQRRDEEEEKKNDESLISSPSNFNYKEQLKHQQQNNRNNNPFPKTSNKMFIDYKTISRDTFLNNTNNMMLGDLGVPLDSTKKGAEDVLIIYTSKESLPTKSTSTKSTSTNTKEEDDEQNKNTALENCHTVKVILQSPPRPKQNQCLVIIPQWDSYTIHKYMRLENIHNSSSKVDLTQTFKNAPRSREADGTVLGFGVPSDKLIKESYNVLTDYLNNFNRVLAELKLFFYKITMKLNNKLEYDNNNNNKSSKNTQDNDNDKMIKNTFIIMTCNKGQSLLFRNFVCNARAKNLDLSRIVMFATDKHTVQLCHDLNIHVYYDETIFGDMPEQSAKQYGDRTFSKMMMAKVYCVHLTLSLGYNILYQDVDIIWNKNPLSYLLTTSSPDELTSNTKENKQPKWDMMFQDDGSRQSRFAPYSPNSGFYFVRNTQITKYFFNILLRRIDMIYVSKSHQAVLNDLLIEFSSWKGLKTKIFHNGYNNLFMGGSEYHNNIGLMKDIYITGKESKPYIHHMSWTENKDNKKLFLEQLGEWYTVEDTSPNTTTIDTTTTTTTTNSIGNNDNGNGYCLLQPNITCHYRDKPSIIPCTNSPPIVKNGISFW